MDRRGFFKILSATSAGIATTGCGHKTDALIPLLVPEHEIVPGEEQWHPAVCTECAAGCGTIVRVMEGVRTVDRNGEKFRERIAAVKKIEGNPLDPVSGGRLCARGQAVVQSLYDPSRLRGPMKKPSTPVSWDEAIAAAADKLSRADRKRIVFLTGPGMGTRSLSIARFMEALGVPPPVMCSLVDLAAERRAAEQVFGWKGLPVFDLAHAHTILGAGTDFLGGWASPVFYARQYGAFRQGRRSVRGRLIHAESRLSLTSSSADRWIPILPGSEEAFLAAVGRLLFASAFPNVDAAAMLAACGADERRVREAVAELKESDAPLVVGKSALALHINQLLGNVGKPGGVLPPGTERPTGVPPSDAQVVLIDGANPAYTRQEWLAHAETIVSFAGFLDESAARADLILPGHHPLESEMAVVPAVSPRPGVAAGTPFIRPLYDTRPVEQTLGDIAKKMGVEYHAATVKDLLPSGANLADALRQGGWWGDAAAASAPKPQPIGTIDAAAPARNSGELLFQVYPSLQFGDGSGHNVAWLQEMPDPASSSIWGLPIEIDPQTASRNGISTGDAVRVESAHGSLEAPAYVHPGAIPGVVSMPLGGGRGPNPLPLLAGAAAVPVRLARVGPARGFTQFSTPDREEITHR
jgi:molybdopterin-containing oxidoreductase family iron-sulfur binding subunit